MSFAQAPDTLWTKVYGSVNLFENSRSVQQTQDGGYVLFGNVGVIEPTSLDAYIIKTDSLGETLWTRVYDIDSVDCISDGKQTFDGGYICAGSITSYFAGQESTYILLMKLNSQGDSLWTRIFTDVEAVCYSVCQSVDSGYIMVGEWYGAGSGVYIVKTDAVGNTIWTKTYGAGGDDYGWQVCRASDNGYYIVGSTTSFGNGSYDIWVLRTDENGDTLWARTYGGLDVDYAGGINATTDGGCIVVGQTYSFSQDIADIWLLRINEYGDTLWTTTFGGDDWEWGSSVQQTSDEGFILIGFTYSFGVDSTGLWIIKTDVDGSMRWNRLYDGSHYDLGECIRQTSDQGYIAVGGTWSFSGVDYDIWLLKISPDSFVVREQRVSTADGYELFSTIFTGSLLLPKDKGCKVFDITGREVKPHLLAPGIYFIEIEGKITQKVIKIR